MYAPGNPDVNETVLAEWTDAHGHDCTLGSLTPCHKRDAGFTLKVTTDEQQRVWAWFILAVTVKTAGRERQRELALVIPPHSSYALTFHELEISQIHTPAVFSAVGDARLFDSGRVIRANFALPKLGYVLMPKSTAKKIAPASRTTSDLLRGLRSLSETRSFSIYIKPSDYARQGLKLACDRNSAAPPPASPFAVEDVLDTRTTEVDWDLFGIEPDNLPSSAPPPYLGPTPPLLDCEHLLPLSPAAAAPAPSTPTKSVVSETDFSQIPPPSIHTSPSPQPNLQPLNTQKRPLSPNTAAAPDILPSAQRPRRGSSAASTTRNALTANLAEWVEAALAVNHSVYEHPRLQDHLQACATHAVAADVDGFLDSRAALGAEFYYDPDGVDGEEAVGEEVVERAAYVADMARLLRWALKKRWSADVENLDTFVFLGKAAKAAVMNIGEGDGGNGNGAVAGLWRDPYRFRKSLCVNCVLLSCVPRPPTG